MTVPRPLQSLGHWLWPAFTLPAPTGPHRIGTTWRVVTDSTRKERFADVPDAVRELPVKLWYPAAGDATGPPGAYAAPESMTTLLPLALNQRLRRVKTHAIADAPMAGPRAPVLVFSHGYGGYAEQNTVQMEELASRGYVVASIAHPGEAAWAPLPGGRGMPYGGLLDGSISVPLLVLVAGDEGQAAWLPGLDRCRGPTWLAKVPRTTHLGMTDLPLQVPAWLRWTGWGGRMPAAQRGRIISDCLVAFFEQQLRGGAPAGLAGLSQTHPEVIVTQRHVH